MDEELHLDICNQTGIKIMCFVSLLFMYSISAHLSKIKAVVHLVFRPSSAFSAVTKAARSSLPASQSTQSGIHTHKVLKKKR